jgi:hypothetical protein
MEVGDKTGMGRGACRCSGEHAEQEEGGRCVHMERNRIGSRGLLFVYWLAAGAGGVELVCDKCSLVLSEACA